MVVIEYNDEIGYQTNFWPTQQNPEEILINKEDADLQEKMNELKESLQQKMREIVVEKFEKVLTKKEYGFLSKLLLEIDEYYPDEENQYAVADKIGVTREYLGLLMHRIHKKIKENEEIKKECLREYNRLNSKFLNFFASYSKQNQKQQCDDNSFEDNLENYQKVKIGCR